MDFKEQDEKVLELAQELVEKSKVVLDSPEGLTRDNVDILQAALDDARNKLEEIRNK